MKNIAALLLIAAVLPSACTYEGLRSHERSKCSAMPPSQAERCFNRTRMTKEEYDTEREKLKGSEGTGSPQKNEELDPRYEKWIP